MLGVLFIFVLLMFGILFGMYWILKTLGKPKLGRYLSIGLATLLMLIISYGIFQDSFFTKNQAREILAEQNIILKDDFKILNNKTRSPMADYYHRFRLEISDNDKNQIIDKIKNSEDFKGVDDDKIDLLSNSFDIQSSKVIQNYEDSEMFVTEYYRPDHEGGESIYKRVELEKAINTIVFVEMRNK